MIKKSKLNKRWYLTNETPSPRLPPHPGARLGQHVRLHPGLHPDGWVPGAERRPGGGRVLQGAAAHQPGPGAAGHLLARDHLLHRGAGGGRAQHLRGGLLLQYHLINLSIYLYYIFQLEWGKIHTRSKLLTGTVYCVLCIFLLIYHI